MSRLGHPFGLHRVLGAAKALPQAAPKLDVSLPIYDNELLIAVECLNIDSTSFRQLVEECHGDENQVAAKIIEIVAERGKMHNPVTGSGGVLVGTIKEIGINFPHSSTLRIGDPVVTLVSLTLTPLFIDRIFNIDADHERVYVQGYAILFAGGPFARLPDDLPRGVALAALDVCGAPAYAARWIKRGDLVLVIGGGKSGKLILACAQAMGAKTVCVEYDAFECQVLRDLKLADHVIQADAQDAVSVREKILAALGQDVDIAFNCANVPDTEMAAVLSVRQGGVVVFFSMATNFAKPVLGAEGLARDLTLIMGNGYAPGHAELTLNLLRTNASLQQWFVERYGE